VVPAGGNVLVTSGVDSEVGQLTTVLMHRPGPELERITSRHRDRLLFGTLPWASRARQEHDVLSQTLRDRGVEVLYLTELLQDALEYQAARQAAIALAVGDAGLGDDLRSQLRAHLEFLGPEALARVLIAGLTPAELRLGHGVVFELLDQHDFVLDPLPNLIFTKDASVWIGERPAIASLAGARRHRESGLAAIVYQYHPRFAGVRPVYQPHFEHLDGGDVLLLAPGAIAVGVGERTTAAGTERLARRAFAAGLAHSVLAVPMSQAGGGHFDTICAVVDADTIVMNPAIAYSLTALAITPHPDGLRVSRPRPFLQAAAQAMGIERLHVIDAGTEPTGQCDHGDDGSNILAIAPRIVVCHERNSDTNARLEDAGITVIPVPSSELGSTRGGPRCMSCPVSRAPLAPSARAADPDVRPLYREELAITAADEQTSPVPIPARAPVPAVAASSADELASAHLAGCREAAGRWRPPTAGRQRRADLVDPRRPRNIPSMKPRTTTTAASRKSHISVCRIAITIETTTKTATTAAPISSRKRSMHLSYVRLVDPRQGRWAEITRYLPVKRVFLAQKSLMRACRVTI
jgi:arginine deiminase